MGGNKFVEDLIEEAHGGGGFRARFVEHRIVLDLNLLRDECFRVAEEKGFHDLELSVPEHIALIHSELSEALEAHREDPKAMEPRLDEKGKPIGIPSEMADVIIRVLDFCGVHGIDIHKAVRGKIEYNKTRPYKHGKAY